MKYKGVNLGGWLVLERWMTPSLFDGLRAKDEFGFMEELGAGAAARLERHRDNFITEEDIEWIAAHGLNAVRLPTPHWAFADTAPFVKCDTYIDWLMGMAAKHGIKVLLDVHTAPGSQNGWPHSGREGEIAWHKDKGNIAATIEFIREVAARYAQHPAILGIELLNEPHPSIPQDILLDFYRQGIDTVRRVAPDMTVVVSDAFRPDKWHKTFLADEPDVWLDMHLYRAFDEADKKLPVHKHIRKVQTDWQKLIHKVQKRLPVAVGEWSLGLDKRAFRGLDDFGRDKGLQAYGSAQRAVFEQSQGWFFWSYKTEDMAGWSYRTAHARGWVGK